MPSINQVALSGRLVQDPEFRLTENGTARLTGRLAVNRTCRKPDGDWEEETNYFNITIWGRLAEQVAERLHKGTPLFVTGRLRSHSWKDDDEQSHSLVEVVVRNVQILERAWPEDDLDGPGPAAELVEDPEA